MQDQKKGKRKLHNNRGQKLVTAKKAMTNGSKGEFTSLYCRIAAKTDFFLLLFPAHFVHARYSSRMIDRFFNWGNHGKPKVARSKAVLFKINCYRWSESILTNFLG